MKWNGNMKINITKLEVTTGRERNKIHFFGFVTLESRKQSMDIILKSKIAKTWYMKTINVFSANKALISNDTDPSGEKSRNRGTQRNRKVWNAKNMVMMLKLVPKRTRIEKSMQ